MHALFEKVLKPYRPVSGRHRGEVEGEYDAVARAFQRELVGRPRYGKHGVVDDE